MVDYEMADWGTFSDILVCACVDWNYEVEWGIKCDVALVICDLVNLFIDNDWLLLFKNIWIRKKNFYMHTIYESITIKWGC